ncbi:hypothetical protein BG000_009524 [Podila horticola]|nr:hypothetical protein BG000_009524 [Podila horticola]
MNQAELGPCSDHPLGLWGCQHVKIHVARELSGAISLAAFEGPRGLNFDEIQCEDLQLRKAHNGL